MQKKLLSAFLALAMVLTVLPAAAVANQAPPESRELVLTDVDGGTLTGAGLVDPAAEARVPESEDLYAPDETVRILIAMAAPDALDAGYSPEELLTSAEAASYMGGLEEVHQEVARSIESELLRDGSFEYRESFTIITNAFEATARYGDLEELDSYLSDTYAGAYAGLYIVPRYEIQAEEDAARPDTHSATEMVGAGNAWTEGYTGAGSRVAIIDTGIDPDHPSFDADAFQYSLEMTAIENGQDVDSYDLMTRDDVALVLEKLHAFEDYDGTLTADDVYRSAKIPFGYNYVDDDLNITHDLDEQGDHGSHVSGIAAANRYVKQVDANGSISFVPQENGVVGVAPDAQILTMKVFGQGGGAYTSDYMPAIEDAIMLGCDAVNLSLGSAAPGRSYDTSTYAAVFQSMVNSDTVVAFSGGNNGHWPQNNLANSLGLNYSDDVNMHTGGSSGSYTNSFTVASNVNTTITGFGGTFEDFFVVVTDGSNANNAPWYSLDTSEGQTGTDLPYVFLGDPSDPDDTAKFGGEGAYDGVDVSGKVVLVSRGGGVSFYVKHDEAADAGAVACVVYNNAPGTISMTLQGSSATIPCASIQQSEGETILSKSTRDGETGLWGGTVTVRGKVESTPNADGYTMSDFSSWGPTSNLAIKPEITAPGGNIYSTLNDGAYGVMSGTSMAAPSVTGQSAVVSQYVKSKGLDKDSGLTRRGMVMSLLMSTATPLIDPVSALPYSVRQQGAGQANAGYAVKSPAYITMAPEATNTYADGKVKAELGDDAGKSGVYSFTFTVHNITGQPITYTTDSWVLTPEVIEEGGELFMSLHETALPAKVTYSSKGAAEALVYDLSGDGRVDKADIQLVNDFVAGTGALTETQQAFADLNEDGVVTAQDVYLLLAAVDAEDARLDQATVTVPAGGEREITVTITLTQAARDYLESHDPNGSYVEGYAVLRGEVDLSVPFLAFYGNFTDPSMFDRTGYLESYYGLSDKMSYVTADNRVNFLTTRISGSTNAYYFGMNLYAEEESFIPERNYVFSTANGNTLYQVCPTLIRGTDRMKVTICNAEDGTVYWETLTSATAAYYNTSSAAWSSTTSATRLTSATAGWGGTDAEGNKLPDGTKVNITVTAAPELYTYVDESGTRQIREEDLGRGARWTTSLTVDNTYPTVQSVYYKSDLMSGTDQLEITASDDRYVAAVLLFNESGSAVLARTAVGGEEPGATSVVELDLTGIAGDKFIVAVVDYAGNMVSGSVDLSSSGRAPGEDPEDPTDDRVYALVDKTDGSRTWNEVDVTDAGLTKISDVKQDVSLVWRSGTYYAGSIYGAALIDDAALGSNNGKSGIFWMDGDTQKLDMQSGLIWTSYQFCDFTYAPMLGRMVIPAIYNNNATYVALWEPGATSLSAFNLSQMEGLSSSRITGMTYLCTGPVTYAGATHVADWFFAVTEAGECFAFAIYQDTEGYRLLSMSYGTCGVTSTAADFDQSVFRTAVGGDIYYVEGDTLYRLDLVESGEEISVKAAQVGKIDGAKQASVMLQKNDREIDVESGASAQFSGAQFNAVESLPAEEAEALLGSLN